MQLLTNCAGCAAELPHTAPRCSRCHTRYCGSACQAQHWGNGHKDVCKKIKKHGGAEQCHADKKYKEAVAVAVEKCADATKGQTCYICMEGDTKEGLVRGCACGDRESVASGNTGIAHVSCLVRQAKILMDEGEENKLDWKAQNERWNRWHTCNLCEREYHGVVRCALGWGCWKTYVGRPDTEEVRRTADGAMRGDPLKRQAMGLLGNALGNAGRYEEAISVLEKKLATDQRLGADPRRNLVTKQSIACWHQSNEADAELMVEVFRELHHDTVALVGPTHSMSFEAASKLTGAMLISSKHHDELRLFSREQNRFARKALGPKHETTQMLAYAYAASLHYMDDASLDERLEAEAIFADLAKWAQQVLGDAHPNTAVYTKVLVDCRARVLRTRAAEARARAAGEGK